MVRPRPPGEVVDRARLGWQFRKLLPRRIPEANFFPGPGRENRSVRIPGEDLHPRRSTGENGGLVPILPKSGFAVLPGCGEERTIRLERHGRGAETVARQSVNDLARSS